MEDPDSDKILATNRHNTNGSTGIGNGSGTERDKNHLEERRNSFLSQSYSINHSPSNGTQRGVVDGATMKSFSIQPSVTTPLTAKRNLSPHSGQEMKSYGSAK